MIFQLSYNIYIELICNIYITLFVCLWHYIREKTEILPNKFNVFIKMYYFLHLLTLGYEVCTTDHDK